MTHEWWRDAVIYQVSVRGGADGDGAGDLPGARPPDTAPWRS